MHSLVADWYHPTLIKKSWIHPCVSALRQTHSAVANVSILNGVYCTLLFSLSFQAVHLG